MQATDEQINIAIAKACGWTDIKRFQVRKDYDAPWFIQGLAPENWSGQDTRPWLPDFLNDLNAMHEAENVVIRPARLWYRYCLKLPGRSFDESIGATARQRAEAFIKTLNLLP